MLNKIHKNIGSEKVCYMVVKYAWVMAFLSLILLIILAFKTHDDVHQILYILDDLEIEEIN